MGDYWMTSGRSRLKAIERNGVAGRRRTRQRAGRVGAGAPTWQIPYPPSTQPVDHPKRPKSSSEFLGGKKGYVDPFTRRGVVAQVRRHQQLIPEGQPSGDPHGVMATAASSGPSTLQYRRIRHPTRPQHAAGITVLPPTRSRMAPPSVRLQPPGGTGYLPPPSVPSPFTQTFVPDMHPYTQYSGDPYAHLGEGQNPEEMWRSPQQGSQPFYSHVGGTDERGIIPPLSHSNPGTAASWTPPQSHTQPYVPMPHVSGLSQTRPQHLYPPSQPWLGQQYQEEYEEDSLAPLHYQEHSFEAKWGGATPVISQPNNPAGYDTLNGPWSGPRPRLPTQQQQHAPFVPGFIQDHGIPRFQNRRKIVKVDPIISDFDAALDDCDFVFEELYSRQALPLDSTWRKENTPFSGASFEASSQSLHCETLSLSGRSNCVRTTSRKPWESFLAERRQSDNIVAGATSFPQARQQVAPIPVLEDEWCDQSATKVSSLLSFSPGDHGSSKNINYGKNTGSSQKPLFQDVNRQPQQTPALFHPLQQGSEETPVRDLPAGISRFQRHSEARQQEQPLHRQQDHAQNQSTENAQPANIPFIHAPSTNNKEPSKSPLRYQTWRAPAEASNQTNSEQKRHNPQLDLPECEISHDQLNNPVQNPTGSFDEPNHTFAKSNMANELGNANTGGSSGGGDGIETSEVKHPMVKYASFHTPDWLRCFKDGVEVNLRGEPIAHLTPQQAVEPTVFQGSSDPKLVFRAIEGSLSPNKPTEKNNGSNEESPSPRKPEGPKMSPKTAELAKLFAPSSSDSSSSSSSLSASNRSQSESDTRKKRRANSQKGAVRKYEDDFESLSDSDFVSGQSLWGT